MRLIAATSRDLASEIKAGRFREDLYFRLNVARIGLPALRERRADIVTIFIHFVASVCNRYGEPLRAVDDGAKSALLSHSWPGNVRELRNVAERAVLLSNDTITRELVRDIVGTAVQEASADDMPKSLSEALQLKEFRRRSEAHYISHILKE